MRCFYICPQSPYQLSRNKTRFALRAICLFLRYPGGPLGTFIVLRLSFCGFLVLKNFISFPIFPFHHFWWRCASSSIFSHISSYVWCHQGNTYRAKHFWVQIAANLLDESFLLLVRCSKLLILRSIERCLWLCQHCLNSQSAIAFYGAAIEFSRLYVSLTLIEVQPWGQLVSLERPWPFG
jgi:hypothetical protein